MVRVRFIGCGDAFGSGGRFQTCIMIEGPQTTALLDCGPSSLISMKQRQLSPNQVDVILLTHLHGDHFGGIPFFLLDAAFASQRETPLLVAGPPGCGERIRSAQEILFPGSSMLPWRFPLEIQELEPSMTHQLSGLEVTPLLMDHPCGAPATGLRVNIGGRTVSYTGDTQWNDNLYLLARDVDLLIGETYTFDHAIAYHMTYARWMKELKQLAPKRFIATHMSEPTLARASEMQCETAYDGLIIEL